MCPPRDSAGCGCSQRADTGKKLQHEPVEKDEESGDGNQENEHQSEDAFARVEDKVGTHHAGDGATCAYRGKS